MVVDRVSGGEKPLPSVEAKKAKIAELQGRKWTIGGGAALKTVLSTVITGVVSLALMYVGKGFLVHGQLKGTLHGLAVASLIIGGAGTFFVTPAALFANTWVRGGDALEEIGDINRRITEIQENNQLGGPAEDIRSVSGAAADEIIYTPPPEN